MPLLRDEIYLIGFEKSQLTGSKLSSIGDCLRVMFYNLRTVKLKIKDSVRLVVKECFTFWEKARIPTMTTQNVEKKLTRLYEEWREMNRRKSRTSEIYKKKIEAWKYTLDDLFDIAHPDALKFIKIEEDKLFLLKQREKGREGCMAGVDAKLKKTEERRETRKQREETKKKMYQEAPSTSKGFSTYVTSSDESENDESTEANDHIIDPMTTSCPDTLNSSQKQNTFNTKRPSKEILTPRLAAVLDKLKLSSRDTVHMLIAVLDAVGLNSSEYVINRTSIHQQRDAFRKANCTPIGLKLQSNTQPLTIHWDTKLLSGISGKNEDRLSIIATAPDFEQIINIPDIPVGTGVEIASARYET